jgi:uroporphyrinogen III methyltransferase/synthase
VYIVGTGPGDPGLLTVRARDLIEAADAIVFDSSVNRSLIPASARESGRPTLFFVGRSRRSRRRVSAREIEELLVRLAREGQRVVRLVGGDPFVFGTGADEAQALHDASVPFEVIPGITAGIAAVSYAGIPVTHPGMGASVTFVNGSEIPGKPTTQTDWSSLAKAGGTIVVYAARDSAAAITRALLDGGMPDEVPAAAVERGTRRSQRTVTATLSTLAEKVKAATMKGPTILIIGWPVIMRDEMAWFENRPLFGKRIVMAESGHLSSGVATRLRELGAEVFEMPDESVARLDLSPMREAITTLSHFQWVIFTSRNAVIVFWEQLLGSGRDARNLSGLAVAAVGAGTAGALLEHGIAVDVIPDRFTPDSLIEKIRARDDVAGSRVLFVSPEGRETALASEMSEMGAELTVIDAYRAMPDDRTSRKLRRAIEKKTVDLVVFTSVASVDAFVAAAGLELAAGVSGASIGDTVSESLGEAGIDVLCEAGKPTAEALSAAIEQALK